MNRNTIYIGGLLMLGMMLAAGPAQAQLQRMDAREMGRWNANVNTGVLIAENILFSGFTSESFGGDLFTEAVEAAYHVSGDVNYRFASGLTLGAEGGWSPMNEDNFVLGRQGANAITADKQNLYLYSANLGYIYPMGRVGLYGRAGVGGATLAIDRGVAEVSDETRSHWQSPVTLGGKIAVSRGLMVDVAARDYIIYGQDSGTTHNFYFGAGLSFLF